MGSINYEVQQWPVHQQVEKDGPSTLSKLASEESNQINWFTSQG